jgi:MoxR-like ATPase
VNGIQQSIRALKQELEKTVIGCEQTIRHLLIALIAGGNILIEGPPGLGKTHLCKSLAGACDMGFRRIQCTPDLTPQDILGRNAAEPHLGGTIFLRGPIFSNLILADELNRAQPKTQSAFLESMEEKTVTIQGRQYPLEKPFMLVATQNPVDFEGTYPLPQAQQDRFLIKTAVGHLSPQQERKLLTLGDTPEIRQAINAADIIAVQEHARKNITVPGDMTELTIEIVRASRERPETIMGASTRAHLMLHKALKASALIDGKNQPDRENLIECAKPTLRHKITMNPDSTHFGYTSDHLLDDIIRKTGV